MKSVPPEFSQEVSAAMGSLLALLFTDAVWPRKIAYFLGGWAVSKLFGTAVQDIIGVNIELARALTALFGLAIVEKIFDMIYSVDTKKIARALTEMFTKRF